MVVLPRTPKQGHEITASWSELCASRKPFIPEGVVDGLNLIWHSDLVISGGGTMNREAAALGVPVYSIFRGKIGAVARYLAEHGRLVLLGEGEDIETKIVVQRRERASRDFAAGGTALRAISEAIISIVEHQCLPARP